MAVTGDLSLTARPDLVQLYAGRGETVAIRLDSPTGEEGYGVVYMHAGDVVHAQLGNLEGLPALMAALRLVRGRFSVVRGVKSHLRTINSPLHKLLMDAHESAGPSPDEGAAEVELDFDAPTQPPKPTPEEPMASAKTVPPPPQTQPPPPEAPKGRLPMIAAALALAVVALAVIAWLTMQVQRHKAEAEALAAAAAKDAAMRAAEQQKRDAPPITFGLVGPLSGPAKELGRQMRTGVEVAFEAANEAGGVDGRKLKLVALDDGYEPARTLGAMKELVEKFKVAGFIGNVGTPTAAVALPYVLEQKLLFFGAFTGAPLLRKDPPDRYVFNYRASYAEETAATVKYLVELKRIKPEQIAVFAQKDGYGDAGFEGVARSLRQKYERDPSKLLRVGYERNTVDVGAAVDEIVNPKAGIRAVIMVATYRAAAKFVELLRARGGDQLLTNVSFVGSTALSEELMQVNPKLAPGLIVTQVVPLPESGSTAVLHYRELLAKYAVGERPDFVSLEGYIAGSILVEGLRKAGKDATTEQLVDALEKTKDLDLGFGVNFSFGLSQHQASHKVWGTVIDEKGKFQAIDLD
ncbi:MAG: ABC transporter substrate-binding protein [Deltaproteobacteria bacterium]|nr:ABC transporter substrate-binding protein [Deltaproteobacteria bacterium]